MSAYKQLLKKDIIVSPFTVGKVRLFTQNEFNENGIDRFLGSNDNFSITGSTTGTSTELYESLVYKSIEHLYYSNYLSGSSGSTFEQVTFNTDGTISGPYYTPRFENYLQSTLAENRYIPTQSGAKIGIISINRDLIGDYIKPGSFEYQTEYGRITDNGQGYLVSSSTVVGIIQYSHGLAIISTSGSAVVNVENQISSSFATCSFKGMHTIYETGYYCTINENEFNFTLNKSTLSSSNGEYKSNITGSDFQPYVTTVGLYNENNECLLVAKLAQPVQVPKKVDLTIRVNLDM